MAAPGPASEPSLKVKGTQGVPYIDELGRIDLVFQDPRGSLFLSTCADAAVLGPGRISTARHDGRGSLWLVWEAGQAARGDIRLGKSSRGGPPQSTQLSLGLPGIHHSPDLVLDHRNRPWVVWVNSRRGGCFLCLFDGSSSLLHELRLSPSETAFAPRITVDIRGRPWIFWVGKTSRQDAVFYTFREAGYWREPARLTRRPGVPHIHPAVALNELGFPAVAWSAFDGEDYEIYLRSWDGTGWGKRQQITRNRALSDAQPTLVFHLQNIPVLAWTRAGPEGNTILMSFRENGLWHRPVPLTPSWTRSRSPHLVSQAGRLALSWSDRDEVQALGFSLDPPPPAFLPVERMSLRAHSQSLEDSTFIAFGDSITFGSMNGPYQGIGYVPRLQELVRPLFPAPLVLNHGIPGDSTWEAVSRIRHVLPTELGLYLLLMEGTNDVTALDYSMDTSAFNLRNILEYSLDFGVFPLISTIIPRARSRWTAIYQQRTGRLNFLIATLAEDLRVMRVNNFSAFISFPPEAGGHEALISSDNLHPNDLGYQVMAETWLNKIKVIPYPPYRIQADKSVREGSIRLTWEPDPKILPATQVAHYRIYRKTRESPVLGPIAMVPATESTFLDENISIDQDYLYLISSINDNGIEGPLSAPAAPIRAEPFPPLDIQKETVVNASYFYREYINLLTWRANPENQGAYDVTAYRIYRKTRGQDDGSFMLLGEVPSGQLELMDRNLAGRQEAEAFVYAVSAVDGLGRESPIGVEQDHE